MHCQLPREIMYLTESHKIEILMMIGYGDRSRTQAEVVHLFRDKHPELPPINQGTISKIEAQYRELGHVRHVPRRRNPVIDVDTKLNILLTIQENPKTSARQMARDYSISDKTVLQTIHESKMHPYKMQIVQELREDDSDRRIEFCEHMMNSIDQNNIALEWILFSDESTFTLSGEVNRQNCRYWSNQNPHWIRESHSQYPEKVNVWAGIIGDHVIGPKFFNGNLTGEQYLAFLQEDLIPCLSALFPNPIDPDLFDDRIWFQQDGAPPHFALNVRRYLDENFRNRWIGRRGAIEWPARSPDLTPMDFFLWGYLKSKVFVNKPDSIDTLKERITHEIRQIPPEMLRNARNGFYRRLGHCQEVNGAHFEPFLH